MFCFVCFPSCRLKFSRSTRTEESLSTPEVSSMARCVVLLSGAGDNDDASVATVCVSGARLSDQALFVAASLPSVAIGELQHGENSTFLTNAPAADLWLNSEGGRDGPIQAAAQTLQRVTEFTPPIVSYPFS